MDVGQLAERAVRDLMTRLSGVAAAPRHDPQSVAQDGPLGAAFSLLASADGWGKLALQQVCSHPSDVRAAQDLTVRLEQAARLHPPLARQLEAAVRTVGTMVDGARVPAPR